MPAELTVATELCTAMGALGCKTLHEIPTSPPKELDRVGPLDWQSLLTSLEHADRFKTLSGALINGNAFLYAESALRGRTPRKIEWRGPTRPTGFEMVPADLRIDHVYLVSCKYASNVLINPSPTHLFDHLLQVRPAGVPKNWFYEVAKEEFTTLFQKTKSFIERSHPLSQLPDLPSSLSLQDKALIKETLSGSRWPPALIPYYQSLCDTVAINTANRWRKNLSDLKAQELLLWRMLRISEASYFMLGVSRDARETLRLRIGTPWDWNSLFKLKSLEISPKRAGQPTVAWRAIVKDKVKNDLRCIDGHVEIRWSHGRFIQNPEAKVYLDTPHKEIPGYFSIEDKTPSSSMSLHRDSLFEPE